LEIKEIGNVHSKKLKVQFRMFHNMVCYILENEFMYNTNPLFKFPTKQLELVSFEVLLTVFSTEKIVAGALYLDMLELSVPYTAVVTRC
jgi:hypothetical protein